MGSVEGVNVSGEEKVRSRVKKLLSAEKPQQTLLSSRDCHSYYLYSDWSELAFSLSERSSSENRLAQLGM